MRTSSSNQGFSVRAYAGTTGILLAMNVDDASRKGLLGFAIQKTAPGKPPEWLCGMLPFPKMAHQPGQPIASNVAPIQKFRWSDYGVEPDGQYKYDLFPVYGQPDKVSVQTSRQVTVQVQTASTDLNKLLTSQGAHTVVFTRAAAASQAFERKFGANEAKLKNAQTKGKAALARQTLPPEALAWLTRGTLEQIVNFIALAKDKTWALDVAIYQYQIQDVVDAVNAANKRGVNLRVLYHSKQNDKDTAADKRNLAALPAASVKARQTSAIFHHKFILLSRMQGGQRQPVAVLCGSTNFTFNAVYCQANNVHVTSDAALAQKYLEHFEQIWSDPANVDPTRQYNSQHNVLDPASRLQCGFSPRAGEVDLNLFASLINSAKRDVLFATAFNLSPTVADALLGQPHDPILRYGIQDKASTMTGYHADRTADFEAAAALSGLEGWLVEKTRVPGQTGPILIHTKTIVVDFTSDNPIVISGSHNFSHPASASNDENYLIFHGNTDIADSYACEVLRFYDAYRYRYVANKTKTKQGPTLTPDDSWTNDYFDATKLKYADRVMFAGSTENQAASASVTAPPGRARQGMLASQQAKAAARQAAPKAKPAAKAKRTRK